MKTRHGVSLLAVLTLLAACATVPASPIPALFDDIVVPRGLVYYPAESTVIESPNAMAVRLVYRGRLEPASLRVAMRTILEAHGWQHMSTSSTPERGKQHVYEKAGNVLQVNIYEGVWFTYIAFDAARVRPAAQASAMGALEPVAASVGEGRVAAREDDGAREGDGAPASSDAAPGSTVTTGASFVQRVRSFFGSLFSR